MSTISAVSSIQLFKLQPINREDKPSGGPFDKAFDTLSKHMEHLSKEAQAYYDTLEAKTELSKQATGVLEAKPWSDKNAKEFLAKHFQKYEGEWEQGGLKDKEGNKITETSEQYTERLKEGLENFKTAQTDFVAESQLKIQRVMQTYNTTASLLNSLQAMLADLNKAIIQKL